MIVKSQISKLLIRVLVSDNTFVYKFNFSCLFQSKFKYKYDKLHFNYNVKMYTEIQQWEGAFQKQI